ncbi:FCGBP protein, partial [Halcyon senegalensis]|nr:FCGBP protein [Halcyon senegalensis]
ARTAFGLRVSFDWYSYARVLLPDAYAGAVCGLCGDADGRPANDFVTRGGRLAADEIQLADGWKVAEVPGCSAGCADCPACDEERKRFYRGDGYCGVIAESDGPFRACHPLVDPAPFLEDCAFDACHHKGHRDTVCKAVAAYVTECQSRGVALETWRTPSFCSPSCPRHSHYELCAPPCPPTCPDPSNTPRCPSSSSPCAEGCVCDAGFVLGGSACVSPARCGCRHAGRYYPQGAEFHPESSACHRRCRCVSGGAVVCRDHACGPHEECRLEAGVLACQPVAYGLLVVSGDPHYVTFDGRSFGLAGHACSYVLARLCAASDRLADFTVLLEHGGGDGGRPALVERVETSIHGHAVVMARGRPWEVTVSGGGGDGTRHTRRLRVSQEGTNIILQSAAGLRLLYNSATYLQLTIPATYRGHLCGLGGNYNGDPADDFRSPDGTLAASARDFIASWQTPPGGNCPSDLRADGDSRPPCATDAAALDATAARDSCGLLRDPTGPFGLCHPRVNPAEYFRHCLHDVCAAAGADAGHVLCHSLQAYAAACQAAGARLGAWRTQEFC